MKVRQCKETVAGQLRPRPRLPRSSGHIWTGLALLVALSWMMVLFLPVARSEPTPTEKTAIQLKGEAPGLPTPAGQSGSEAGSPSSLRRLWVSLVAAWESWITKACVLALAIVILCELWLLHKANQTSGQLSRAIRTLGDLSPDEAQDVLLQRIESTMPSLPSSVRKGWKELRGSMISVNGRLFSGDSEKAELDDESLLEDIRVLRLPFRLVHSFPGVMTGLGMLGTFGGIAEGLGQISELQGAGSAALVSGVGEVVIGLASAFWTSIFGLVPALVLNIIAHGIESNLLSELDKFRDALHRLFPKLSPELLLDRAHQIDHEQLSELSEIRRESREGRVQLQHIANDLADAIGTRFQKALEAHMLPHLQTMVELVREQVAQASTNAENSAQQFTQAMVSNLSGALQDSFTGMVVSMEAFQTRFGEVSTSLETLLSSVDASVQQQRALLSEGMAAVQQAADRSRMASEDLARTQQAAKALQELLAQVQTLQNETATLHRDQSAVQQQTAVQMNDISRDLRATSQVYRESAAELRTVIPELHRSLAELGGQIGGLGATSIEVGERLQTSVRALGDHIAAEERLLTGYRATTSSIIDAFRQAEPAMDSMNSLAQQFDDHRAGLERTLQGLDEMRERTASAAGILSGRLGDSSRAFEAVTQRLQELIASTQAWGEQTRQALAQSGMVIEASTQTWSRHTTAAIEQFGSGLGAAIQQSLQAYDGSLASAVQSLMAGLHQLEDRAEELNNGAMDQNNQLAASVKGLKEAMKTLEELAKEIAANTRSRQDPTP